MHNGLIETRKSVVISKVGQKEKPEGIRHQRIYQVQMRVISMQKRNREDKLIGLFFL
jgi:hypothetical protein